MQITLIGEENKMGNIVLPDNFKLLLNSLVDLIKTEETLTNDYNYITCQSGVNNILKNYRNSEKIILIDEQNKNVLIIDLHNKVIVLFENITNLGRHKVYAFPVTANNCRVSPNISMTNNNVVGYIAHEYDIGFTYKTNDTECENIKSVHFDSEKVSSFFKMYHNLLIDNLRKLKELNNGFKNRGKDNDSNCLSKIMDLFLKYETLKRDGSFDSLKEIINDKN
jgi:hypothetical protein